MMKPSMTQRLQRLVSSLPLPLQKLHIGDVNGDGLNGVGDIIEYTIVVTNTGNTKLTSTTIIDSLTDGLGNTIFKYHSD